MQSIPYSAYLSEANIRVLDDFSWDNEKSKPLVFVGREDIKQQVLARLFRRRLADGETSPTKGVFITGAPGVGKTSLLQDMLQGFRSDSVTPIYLGGESLNSPITVIRESFRAYHLPAHSPDEQQWREYTADVQHKLALNIDIWEILQDALNPPEGHKFLFLIDEAQRAQKDRWGEINTIAVQLHDGITGEIDAVPVFTGLSDMPQKLDEVGLSRPSAMTIRMRSLSTNDSIEVVNRFLDIAAFGLKGSFADGDRKTLATTLAIASEGWPRHLHYYLQGLTKQLVEDAKTDQNKLSLNLEAIIDYGDKSRFSYSEQRYTAANLHADYADCLMDLSSTISDTQALSMDVLEQHANARYLSNDDLKDNLDRSLHAGLLEPLVEEDSDVSRPHQFTIPSIQTYLRCRRDRRKVLAELRSSFEIRMRAYEKSVEGESRSPVGRKISD